MPSPIRVMRRYTVKFTDGDAVYEIRTMAVSVGKAIANAKYRLRRSLGGLASEFEVFDVLETP